MSAVELELDPGDVLADHGEDLAPQPVVLLVGVVDPVGVGILPVVGDREAPSAVAPPEVGSGVHGQHPTHSHGAECRWRGLVWPGAGLVPPGGSFLVCLAVPGRADGAAG